MVKVGVLETPGWRSPFDTVDSLARSILYQQLSGQAAATIVGRLEMAAGSKSLTPEALSRVDDVALRACGVSGNKALALRDLSRRAQAGEVPDSKSLLRLHDEEIIEALTSVRGIGRWTVQMMLMFRLGRPDILPVDDLGVRKGAQLLDHLDEMPKPKQLALRGEAWGPYRTLAGLYLWRIADFSGKPIPAPATKSNSRKPEVGESAANKGGEKASDAKQAGKRSQD